MSLFQFGFTRQSRLSNSQQAARSLSLPHLPEASECGLGLEEHSAVITSMSELVNPEPSAKKRKTKGHYTHYSEEDHAKIGK